MKEILNRSSKPLIAIWGLLLIAGLVSLGLGRWALAFVSISTLILSLLPPLLAARWSLTLPVPFLFATTLFFIGSIFMGEALDFYERLWWWDLVLHGSSAIGFGLTGFLFVFMLFEGDKFAAPPSAIAFIAFCVAMMVGAMWEIFEFTMDQTLGLNMQKSGLLDTMGDLIVDAIGGLIASLAGYGYLVRRKHGVLGRLIGEFVDMNKRLYRKSRDRLTK